MKIYLCTAQLSKVASVSVDLVMQWLPFTTLINRVIVFWFVILLDMDTVVCQSSGNVFIPEYFAIFPEIMYLLRIFYHVVLGLCFPLRWSWVGMWRLLINSRIPTAWSLNVRPKLRFLLACHFQSTGVLLLWIVFILVKLKSSKIDVFVVKLALMRLFGLWIPSHHFKKCLDHNSAPSFFHKHFAEIPCTPGIFVLSKVSLGIIECP